MAINYTPPMSAFGAGLERGIGIVRDYERDLERKEDRKIAADDRARRISNEDEDRAHTRKVRAQQDDDYEWKQGEQELKLLDDDVAAAKGAINDAAAKYGGYDKIPPAEMQQLQDRIDGVSGGYNARRAALMRPRIEKMRSAALERIKKGDFSNGVEDLTLVTRRPVSDFMRGENGEPSPIEQAHDSFLQAYQSGDRAGMANAANILLRPELGIGTGVRHKGGVTITGKEIVDFVPSPNGGGRVMPVLSVTEERDDGATRKRHAGLTAGRGRAEDGDKYADIDLTAAFDRLGNLRQMVEIANAPGVREQLAAGAAKGAATADSLLRAMNATSVKEPAGKYETKQYDRGGKVDRITADKNTGIPVRSETLDKTLDPNKESANTVRLQVEGVRQAGATQRNDADNATSTANNQRTNATAAANNQRTNETRTATAATRAAANPRGPNSDAEIRRDFETEYGKADMRSRLNLTLEEYKVVRANKLPSPPKGAIKQVTELPKSPGYFRTDKGLFYRNEKGENLKVLGR